LSDAVQPFSLNVLGVVHLLQLDTQEVEQQQLLSVKVTDSSMLAISWNPNGRVNSGSIDNSIPGGSK